MKRILFSASWLGAVLLLTACHKKPDAQGELEKAAAALATPGAAPASGDANAGPPPAAMMQQALADYKAGKVDDALMGMQALRSRPNMTAQQLMAVQDGFTAVIADLYTRAEKGDPQAAAAVARYEQMKNQH